MNNFTFYSPTYFAFGKGQEAETGRLVKRFGGSKVLLHYGGGSVVRSGLLDRVKAALDEEKIPYVELGGVPPPTATIKSTPSLRQRSMPSYTKPSLGFGCTPPSFT